MKWKLYDINYKGNESRQFENIFDSLKELNEYIYSHGNIWDRFDIYREDKKNKPEFELQPYLSIILKVGKSGKGRHSLIQRVIGGTKERTYWRE